MGFDVSKGLFIFARISLGLEISGSRFEMVQSLLSGNRQTTFINRPFRVQNSGVWFWVLG